MVVTRNDRHVDAFGRPLGIGDLVATTFNYRDHLVLCEVVSYTPKRFKVRPLHRHEQTSTVDPQASFSAYAKSSEHVVIVMKADDRDELPPVTYMDSQFNKDENDNIRATW